MEISPQAFLDSSCFFRWIQVTNVSSNNSISLTELIESASGEIRVEIHFNTPSIWPPSYSFYVVGNNFLYTLKCENSNRQTPSILAVRMFFTSLEIYSRNTIDHF